MQQREPSHILRIGIPWIIVTIILEFAISLVALPAPKGSLEALGENQTFYLAFYLGAPLFAFVLTYMAYWVFFSARRQPGDESNGPTIFGSTPVLLIWMAVSFSTVLFLASWADFTLHEVTDAAGPNPMVIQVIAQQWHFTYRYPTYGGVETLDLKVPVNTPIHFELTSLDVVHDFWIYHYDVKQDAVPGVMTHVDMLARDTGYHELVCDELCGIWHGFMHGQMQSMTKADFGKWIAQQQQLAKPVSKYLQPLSPTYYPGYTGNQANAGPNGATSAYPATPQNQAQ